MDIEFDRDKNKRNVNLRGISFDLVKNFDFVSAIEVKQMIDGEIRYFALGYISKRLYALVYTLRGSKLRVISLRKANQREVNKYEQNT